MIATKQRNSLQPSSPYTRGEKYRYTDGDHEGLLRDYRSESQSVPIDYGQRERHSVGTIYPIPKGRQNCFNSYSKNTSKKYEYSLNLDQSIQNQPLNMTHDQINQKYRYEPQSKGQTFKVDFVIEEFDKRRPVNQTTSKQFSTQTKSGPIFKHFQHEPIKKAPLQQKIDIKTYLRNYEPQYDPLSKSSNKKNHFTQTRYNDSLAKSPLMSQKFMQDNFGATDKFKQFKNYNRSKQNQDPKTISKYESKYAGMRNNKRYQITKEEPQNQKLSSKHNDKNNSFQELSIDGQKLLRDSSTQNKNIVEKINRIQKLNQEINKRLQSMLNRKQVS